MTRLTPARASWLTNSRHVAAAAAAVVLCALAVANRVGSAQVETPGNYGVGSGEVFLPKYLAYRTRQQRDNAALMRIRVGHVKGLSRTFTRMAGEIAVDLQAGTYDARLNGLKNGETYSVWLVDRTESEVDVPDTTVGLTATVASGSSARLTGALTTNLPAGFTLDRVVIARGATPIDVVAAGSPNVFQRIFFRRLTLADDSAGTIAFEETIAPPALVSLVPEPPEEADAAVSGASANAGPPMLGLAAAASLIETTALAAGSRRVLRLDRLISRGAELFFEKTFAGNGRTCGTCHPANNNLTIDTAFISRLPANDPLFVAEFNPALAGLEQPVLMRSHGLILENVDGLENPTQKFTMRSVPHTLALQTSLDTDTALTNPPAEMTGWSGDGAPGTGSLREFAIGAVTQHFTRRLQRVAGRDFRLPTERQLDAMEAFQLSLGRETDFTLSKITFQDLNVDLGRRLFVNGTGSSLAGGTCIACHVDAGARATNGQNRNFKTNTEDVLHEAQALQTFPRDGGFGQTTNPNGSFGDQTFNTPPVVEAADTAPFFHNNVVSTLEDVVRFYSGPEFNNATRPAAFRFNFDQTQIDQIADFMRGINVIQNIEVARRELREILGRRGNPVAEIQKRLQTAFEDVQDGIDVLTEGAIFPSAVNQLTSARQQIALAQLTGDVALRRTIVQQAIAYLRGAKNAVATIAP